MYVRTKCMRTSHDMQFQALSSTKRGEGERLGRTDDTPEQQQVS